MEHIEQVAVTATLVTESGRLKFLPRHFDFYGLVFERQLYAQMRNLCEEYTGGVWNFFDLDNGGCYLAPHSDRGFHFIVNGNGFDGTLDPDAAGIVATLFALSHLSFRFPSVAVFADRFHQLRDFASNHPKRQRIFAAID